MGRDERTLAARELCGRWDDSKAIAGRGRTRAQAANMARGSGPGWSGGIGRIDLQAVKTLLQELGGPRLHLDFHHPERLQSRHDPGEFEQHIPAAQETTPASEPAVDQESHPLPQTEIAARAKVDEFYFMNRSQLEALTM